MRQYLEGLIHDMESGRFTADDPPTALITDMRDTFGYVREFGLKVMEDLPEDRAVAMLRVLVAIAAVSPERESDRMLFDRACKMDRYSEGVMEYCGIGTERNLEMSFTNLSAQGSPMSELLSDVWKSPRMLRLRSFIRERVCTEDVPDRALEGLVHHYRVSEPGLAKRMLGFAIVRYMENSPELEDLHYVLSQAEDFDGDVLDGIMEASYPEACSLRGRRYLIDGELRMLEEVDWSIINLMPRWMMYTSSSRGYLSADGFRRAEYMLLGETGIDQDVRIKRIRRLSYRSVFDEWIDGDGMFPAGHLFEDILPHTATDSDGGEPPGNKGKAIVSPEEKMIARKRIQSILLDSGLKGEDWDFLKREIEERCGNMPVKDVPVQHDPMRNRWGGAAARAMDDRVSDSYHRIRIDSQLYRVSPEAASHLYRNYRERLLDSAYSGDVDAQYELAGILLNDGDETSSGKGIRWLRLSASGGSAKAQCDLGRLYIEGNHVRRSLDEGIRWLSSAACQGLKEPLSLIAKTVSESDDELRHITNKNAFASACIWMKAIDNEADVLSNDRRIPFSYVSEDTQRILECARRMSADERLRLARMFEKGDGVEQSRKIAMDLYLSSADEGNAEAAFIVGGKYEEGWFMHRNLEKALDYYRIGDMLGHQGCTERLLELERMEQSGTLNLTSE